MAETPGSGCQELPAADRGGAEQLVSEWNETEAVSTRGASASMSCSRNR